MIEISDISNLSEVIKSFLSCDINHLWQFYSGLHFDAVTIELTLNSLLKRRSPS